MKVTISKSKAIIAGATTLFFGSFTVYYLINGMFPEDMIFLVLALIFGYLFYKNASTIEVTREAITQSFFGFTIKKISWDSVKELGLIGEKLFTKTKNRSGSKYIYFSPNPMTAKERYDMVLKWPPTKLPYMEYNEKLLDYIMVIWNKELKTLNVEDLYPDSEDNQES